MGADTTITVDFNGYPRLIIDGIHHRPLNSTLNAQVFLWIGLKGTLIKTYENAGKQKVQTWKIPADLSKVITLACSSTHVKKKVEDALYSGDFSKVLASDSEFSVAAQAAAAYNQIRTTKNPFIIRHPNGNVLTIKTVKSKFSPNSVIIYKTSKHSLEFRTPLSEHTLQVILHNPASWINRMLVRMNTAIYGVIKFDNKYYKTADLEDPFMSELIFNGSRVIEVPKKTLKTFPVWTKEFRKTVAIAVKYDVDIGAAEGLR